MKLSTEVLNIDNVEIVYVPVNKIIPYHNNPKLHSAKNINKLIKSMSAVPGRIIFHQPISLDKNNVIIAGHGRRLASLELGLKSVPCVYLLDISEEEAIALRLADNEAFSLDYDLQLLEQELNKMSDYHKDHFGCSPPSINDLVDELDTINSVASLKDTMNHNRQSLAKLVDELPTNIDADNNDIDDDEKPDRLETSLCKNLSADLNGEIEVKTPIGYIDIMTDTQIIEVKRVRKWKWALGQILVYGLYHPDHEKRIHLFGRCKESKLQIIKDHCAKFDVVVTWQYEDFRP